MIFAIGNFLTYEFGCTVAVDCYRSYVSSRFFCSASITSYVKQNWWKHFVRVLLYTGTAPRRIVRKVRKAATNSFLCTQEETDSQNTYDMVATIHLKICKTDASKISSLSPFFSNCILTRNAWTRTVVGKIAPPPPLPTSQSRPIEPPGSSH